MTAPVQPPALLLDVPHATYHADKFADVPTLSRGIAHRLISRSPLHAWAAHPKLGALPDSEASEARANGSLLHALLFGGGQEIAIIEADDWRKADTREKRDAALARGALPVLARVHRDAEAMVGYFREGLLRAGAEIEDCDREAVILWREGEVLCRARLDLLTAEDGVIYDAKFLRNGSPGAFARAMVYDGYDLQHAAYTRGLTAVRPELDGRVRMEFLLMETHPPYAVARVHPAESMRGLGLSKWSRAVRLWEKCLAANSWPGYGDGVTEIAAPAWSLQEDFEAALRDAPDLLGEEESNV